MDENTYSSVVVPAMMQKLPENFRLTISRGEEFLTWSMEKMSEAFLKELDLREDHFYAVNPSKIGKRIAWRVEPRMLCIPNRTMRTVPLVWANMPTRTVIGFKTQRNVGVF